MEKTEKSKAVNTLKIGDVFVCHDEYFEGHRRADYTTVQDTYKIYIVNDFHEGGYVLCTELSVNGKYNIVGYLNNDLMQLSVKHTKFLKDELIKNLNKGKFSFVDKHDQDWHRIEEFDFDQRSALWNSVKKAQSTFEFQLCKILFN